MKYAWEIPEHIAARMQYQPTAQNTLTERNYTYIASVLSRDNLCTNPPDTAESWSMTNNIPTPVNITEQLLSVLQRQYKTDPQRTQ